MRLTTGLVEFQVYLEYLQNTFEDNAKAMQMRIKALVNILKQKVSVTSSPHWVWGRVSKKAAQRPQERKANSKEMSPCQRKDLEIFPHS